MIKTNVMRILDKEKISYKTYDYSSLMLTNGLEIALKLNEDPNHVFKTLVTIGKSKNYYIFMVNVASELDLKKCAEVVNEKNIEMIPLKELFPLTGYVHGGCSFLGLKKNYKVTIDSSILNYNTIIFSAGKIGYQVEITIKDLLNFNNIQLKDIKM